MLRMRSHEVLEHPVRAAITRLLTDQPGRPFLEVFNALRADPEAGPGLGHGSLLHHIHMMERFNLIVGRKSGRHRRYYPNGGPWGSASQEMSLLHGDSGAAIARAVILRPGQTQVDVWRSLATELGITRQTVGYHLRLLRDAGLLDEERRGVFRAYTPTELLQRLAVHAGIATPAIPQALVMPVPA